MKAFPVFGLSLYAIALLLAIFVIGLGPAVDTPSGSAATTTATTDAALREVKQAMETCRILLGWKEGTIIRELDFAAFALCMHPTLKKHNLLTPN